MTRTLAVLVAALIALMIVSPAAAHRPGLHPKGTLDAPLLHWRGSLITDTNSLRAGKCLSPLHPRYTRGELPVWLRRYAVRQWLDKRAHAREAESRCLAAIALAWYRTSGAECVHRHEGAWDDGGHPYWGGMQADLDFLRAYGREFLARHGTPRGSVGPGGWVNAWTVTEQIVTAYRGHRARGWSPWPNTARACGLRP